MPPFIELTSVMAVNRSAGESQPLLRDYQTISGGEGVRVRVPSKTNRVFSFLNR